MNLQKLTEENYYKFCHLEGNNYIASEFALYQILKIIEEFEIKSVLEIGLGIGSISDTVLKSQKAAGKSIRYVGTEANEFCKNVLPKNVDLYSEIEQYEDLSQLKYKSKFDLIIIDGQDATLPNIVSFCKERTIIFIEGDRSPQAELVLSIFPRAKLVQLITTKKNRTYSPGNPSFFVGGGRLIFTNPNFKMKIYWFKEKVSSYLKRYYRYYIKS